MLWGEATRWNEWPHVMYTKSKKISQVLQKKSDAASFDHEIMQMIQFTLQHSFCCWKRDLLSFAILNEMAAAY